VEVVREAYPDPSIEPDEKGDWVCVDVKAVKPLQRPVTLAEIKADAALAQMALVKLSRLSVGPVTPTEWKHVVALSKKPAPGPTK
jgi:predicted RNA-binding protein with PUA-like domain